MSTTARAKAGDSKTMANPEAGIRNHGANQLLSSTILKEVNDHGRHGKKTTTTHTQAHETPHNSSQHRTRHPNPRLNKRENC